jgi:hypothetical protein
MTSFWLSASGSNFGGVFELHATRLPLAFGLRTRLAASIPFSFFAVLFAARDFTPSARLKTPCQTKKRGAVLYLVTFGVAVSKSTRQLSRSQTPDDANKEQHVKLLPFNPFSASVPIHKTAGHWRLSFSTSVVLLSAC